jgi:hypothetical protein
LKKNSVTAQRLASSSSGFFASPSEKKTPLSGSPSSSWIADLIAVPNNIVSPPKTPLSSLPPAPLSPVNSGANISANKTPVTKTQLTTERRNKLLHQWFESNATNRDVLPTKMKWAQFFRNWDLYVDEEDLLQLAKQPPEESDMVEQASKEELESSKEEEKKSEEWTTGIHWCGPSAVRKDKYVFIFPSFNSKIPVSLPWKMIGGKA